MSTSENPTTDGDETNTETDCKSNLERILQQKEKWIRVDDLDESPGCPPGENFVADVLRVVVYGRRLCLGVWTDIRKNLIIKRVPEPSSPRHRLYNCLLMFRNEIAAYEHVLPMCQSYLDKKSPNESNQLCFPKFYGQCQSFLVLQDLQTEGYQLVNRVRGFTLRECSAILRELSKFHALSFALKEHEKPLFSKTIDKLKETVFREEYIHNLTGTYWEDSVKLAIRSLKESRDPRLRKAIIMLMICSGSILTNLINMIQPDFGKFQVICHGDLWNNNVLLRYSESGYPIAVKFIDLQAMRYSSCVLDVMHVLFTSSRPVVHERYLNVLLSLYYDSLVDNLAHLETVPDFTFDDFMDEFKRKISFGVLVACLMLTCVTRTSEPTDAKPPETESEFEKTYKSLSPGYHERLHALFLGLTDSNLI